MFIAVRTSVGVRATYRSFFTTAAYNMPIKVGDKLPSVTVHEGSPNGEVNISEVFAGKKAVLFAVPGAFTPGCSKNIEILAAVIVDCSRNVYGSLCEHKCIYSLIVEDGVVKHVNLEPDGGGLTCSLSTNILSQL
ncbi:peroxiredoxin-5, mitochondrial-like [Saccoglossus kowalevskii]|uniref:Peroxiredoxin-5, mitochondrial-like n=1 Tax=Saccoglossus kowalevskii TaxID=10224 RepID=A0ABM0MYY9_SACKO|nr:PREDICTED: peroxiredoxin-5, mitochondrial-like [Saccoglossus kowalevskii]